MQLLHIFHDQTTKPNVVHSTSIDVHTTQVLQQTTKPIYNIKYMYKMYILPVAYSTENYCLFSSIHAYSAGITFSMDID